MKIAGLQKTTLIDYPGQVACTIFLFGCNFRCGFCYNSELVLRDTGGGFSEEDVLKFLDERQGKLDAVCISGGEPLMTLNLDFVKKIKDMGFKVKVDTNGSFPDVLERMIEEGLIDAAAMDIKGPKDKYGEIVCANIDMDKIEKSMKLVSSLPDYEFRTTVVGRHHSLEDIKSLSEWLNNVCEKRPMKYFLQGFKPEGNLIDKDFFNEKKVTERYLNELRDGVLDLFDKVEVRV